MCGDGRPARPSRAAPFVTSHYLRAPRILSVFICQRKFAPHPRSLYKTRQTASLRKRSGGFPRPSQPQPEEEGTCINFSPRLPVLRFSALHFLLPRRTTAALGPRSPFTIRISSLPATI